MKKILGLAFVAALIFSCSNKKNREVVTETVTTTTTEVKDDMTARNSLDFKGTYKGTLPCADCDKMEVELKLDDNDFTRTTVYHKNGKTTKSEEKGRYTWQNDGNTIMLEGISDSPSKYFVGENTLTQLDMDGNRITGTSANMYVLKK